MPELLLSPLVILVRKTLSELKVSREAHILAGVSGGADSMVMVYILKELGYRVTATHVNFQLRGEESDHDALLVREWCSVHDVPYMEYGIDTKKYSEEHHLNTQSAAREIRYAWWESLVKELKADFVATAHHHDDAVETVLMNLIRGTGLKGLSGIPAKRDAYIRPMIHATRQDIESFAVEYEIPFRTDSSNLSDDYLRNRVRHHLVPLLRELSPAPGSILQHSLERIRIEWAAWESAYQHWQKTDIREKTDAWELKVNAEHIPYLLRWLEEKGWPWNLCYDYVHASSGNKGSVLDYEGYSLSRMAGGFYLEKKQTVQTHEIPGPGHYELEQFSLTIDKVPAGEFIIPESTNTVYVNLSVVKWPMTIRPVQEGDHFQPFGMHGSSRKLQDLLVDLKLPIHEKQKVSVLVSDQKIIWVVGLRLAEVARVQPGKDEEIYRITVINLTKEKSN